MNRMISKFPTKIILKLLLPVILSIFFLITAVIAVAFLMGPPSLSNDENTIYYDNQGNAIGEEKGNQSRYWVTLDQMSPHVIDATLVIEDQHFYNHNGFDFKRIVGALLKDIKTWSLREGASTLTQQYARNLYLSHEKTWTRKIKEAFYTIRLEMYYSKEEILEGYLNTVYYGHGAYGIEEASNYFFNKPAAELTLSESAMLAGIPKGPTYYSPLNDAERANNRQQLILHTMKEKEKISTEEYTTAANQELTYTKSKEKKDIEIGPYFQDTVLQEASNILQLDMESIRSGGYKIYTTLNKDAQEKMQKTIEDTIDSESDVQVGALAVNPKSGAVEALVGGRNYNKSQFNRVTQAKRMPGSAFKPYLYYAALENGFTPSMMLMSKPTAFEVEDGEVYQPSNYNDYYAYEPITLAQAIVLSDNIYAVKTNMYLGSENLVKTARKFGIESDLPAVPSLALGTATVSVEEMVRGYSMLANGGYAVDTHTVKKIVDREGKTVYEREEPEKDLVLDPKTTFILTQMMTGMFDESLNGYTSVTGASIAPLLTRTYAGKSGTTNSDSWMIGYTPNLVSGVWVGYDNNKRMTKAADFAYSKEIWAKFMESALEGQPEDHFSVPSGLVAVAIDPITGEQATPYCPTSTVMFFEKGTEPQFHCSEHFHKGPHQPDDHQKLNDEEEKGTFEKWFDMFFGGI
ncbi:transglycosylase domain-containing protein [Ornithinibacillus halophilus]|uniref:Penicillin-binding protein, 1A family n=1 Tax=Ornithinibacillus halophilus TaxID=930117 RepID=A0A1M5LSY2_9BACI|nr:penicillin-binding protein, 1A family [Ornithinibacillus halophilus]